MSKITDRQARLCFRILVEYLARKRCGEDMVGMATHCGVSTGEIDTVIESAKTEGLIDSTGRIVEFGKS